jgi:hypothetical protein
MLLSSHNVLSKFRYYVIRKREKKEEEESIGLAFCEVQV